MKNSNSPLENIDVERLDNEVQQILSVGNIFTSNMDRIDHILQTSKKVETILDSGDFFRFQNDIFRMATVLLHSSFETTLREIIRMRLKEISRKKPPNIPLVGSAGRSEKFTFADIHKYRDRTVSQLIDDSIDEYVSTMTFSSSDSIVSKLKSVELDVSNFSNHLGTLNEMIMRRHKIVHEADHKIENGEFVLNDIDYAPLFNGWWNASSSFIKELILLAVHMAPYQQEIRNAAERLTKENSS
jgi:hypothetical protein